MKYKPNFHPELEHRARQFYAEHFRRLTKSRYYAKWVRYQYPVYGLLFFGVPSVGIILGVWFLYSLNHPKFVDVLPPDSQATVMPMMWAAAFVLMIIGLVGGISLGLEKSRQLIFQAEEYELKLRQEFNTQKLAEVLAQLETPKTNSDSSSGEEEG